MIVGYRQQGSNRAEIEGAIRDAQAAARDAATSARDMARDAARLAREQAPQALGGAEEQPARAPAPPGTIIIPSNGPDPDVQIRVEKDGIHVSQNGTETTIPIHDIVPRGAIEIAWAIPATLSIFFIWWPISRAVVRWLNRKQAVATDLGALQSQLSARFETMERNIDTVAVEVERLSEGQRFTNKLIAERQAVPVDAPRGL